MQWSNFSFLVLLTWPKIVNCEQFQNEFLPNSVGVLDNLINQTLESLRPTLSNFRVEKLNFETGPQEFGNFKGNVSAMIIEGLNEFNVKIIDTSLLDVNNLTIEENFTAKGFYYLNGTLAFPLGKHDIHLFGDGEFSVKFTKFSMSVKMKIRFDNGTKIVKDFDIVVELDKIQAHFKNLMGGGELEKVFNQLLNDVGLTVFNYYKEPILNTIKPQIKQIICDMLNKQYKNEFSNTKTEL